MIIEDLRNFIARCPCLDKFQGALNVECLSKDAQSYTISTTPVDPIVKRCINGDTVRQFAFVFASTELHGTDVMDNLDNCGFYEEFSEWLDQCTFDRNLPDLGKGRTARRLQATTPGYVFNREETVAQYQIQCKLIYYQERK